ncbi:hypothetical protein DL89DRAFT_295752 [Linderina pennispora]|uniref:Uncharacterized protein n=1 Tax=Linderina pennispora TaxID=61395 RepID=A0A1Y1VYX9_9FUNG|nr:uncharacterized protein DL89DRAFT_295752 [Linderina pennispora]ORX66054.1 hypothetical protein DL89DRAFT_295752 [Linderina pennispora]
MTIDNDLGFYAPLCPGTVDIPNPRPYQRSKNPTVKCHSLLRCTSESCKRAMAQYRQAYSSRLLNRDLAAVLNFRLIFQSLCDSSSIPERLCRSTAIAADASGTTPATKRPRKRRAAAD